ncbi:mucolipin-3-like [Saccostrea cucullata]|uniref:mucolipin-3-like n=1 Tax=Saccostrea cuccullata TaxID=36930 RepID=UPI002ED57C74
MADNNKELESKEDNSRVSCRVKGHQSRLDLQTINLPRSTGRINELTHMASTNTLPNDIDNTAGQTTEGPTPKKTLKRVASFYTPYMEDRLRRKLKFHFMGPHEKFKAKRKCPWKLVLQIFKVFLVTAQLIMFGYERALFVEYVELNNIAMKHMYLLKWDPSFETMPYPPATGRYAIYSANDLIDHVNFAMKQFNHTEELTLGSLRFANRTKYLNMCVEEYREGRVYDNNTYVFDPKVTTDLFNLEPVPVYNETSNSTELQYDLLAILKNQNRTLYFDRVSQGRQHSSRNRSYFLKIVFDDSNKDGQMVVGLFSSLDEFKCSGRFKNTSDDEADKLGQMFFGLKHAYNEETVQFFKTRYRKDLSFYDKFEFVNLWYVLIVINDILTVVGSSFKIQLERRHAQSSSENYDLCALMLGTGSLLVWMGVIRYIGFFKTFNILTVVLKKAFPDMMRFLVTTMMLYLGFMFCGWAVLGPYHIKFRHLSTASECLFSLVNGDDMFVTFSATVTEDTLVWYYSRIYLYLFVSLFIYAVLNLFIAVILDTYETIKEYYEKGFPKSELFEFIDECEDSPDSELYRGEDQTCSCGVLSLLCCFCCKKKKSGSPSEYTSLLH